VLIQSDPNRCRAACRLTPRARAMSVHDSPGVASVPSCNARAADSIAASSSARNATNSARSSALPTATRRLCALTMRRIIAQNAPVSTVLRGRVPCSVVVTPDNLPCARSADNVTLSTVVGAA
jgi:hypothetical protein